MKRHRFALLFLLIPTISAGSSAAVIHVPGDRPTIQAGIDSSSDGDTVLVDPGTYYENINFHGKNIVLAGHYLLTRNYDDILGTVIDGSQPAHPDTASCVLFINGEDSTTVLEGFTLTGGTGTLWRDIHNGNLYREGGGILMEFSGPVVRNNVIVGNDATGPGGTSAGGGGIRIGDAHPTITGNVIAYNAGKYGGGIVLNYTAANIRNNIIYRNSGGADYGGSGIWMYAGGSGPKVIENNTIMENASATYGGGVYVGQTSALLRNNIIWANTAPEGAQIILDGGATTVSYSDVEGGWPGTGNLNVDPGIGDTTHRLEPSSPCIDAGDPGAAYNDPEDTLSPGSALFPSRGGLRNDIGAFGGPGRGLAYLRIHRNAPLPPSGLSAYSDYLTPGSIAIDWTDPSELFNGQPVPAFEIHLYRDSALIAVVTQGVESYADSGLLLHQEYHYLLNAVTAADSSPFAAASAIAGGSATPAAPTLLTPADSSGGCILRWLNPSRQTDGTPLNDFAMAYLYRDGVPFDSIPMSPADTGAWSSRADTAAGYHSYRVRVRDDETPRHFSAFTDSVLGFGGLLDSYHEDFEEGAGYIYATGGWDTTSALGFGGSAHSFTDSPSGSSTISSTTYAYLPPVRLAGRYGLAYRNIGIIRGAQFASVEISTDGRKSFTTLRMYNAFYSPKWMDASADSADWIGFTLDLSPFEGDTATIRLKLQTGPLEPWDGWYLDDISIARVDPGSVDTLGVFPGWSMVSLPVGAGGAVGDLFPSARSAAWRYEGGYLRTDTVLPGAGYWMKFDSGAILPVTGEVIPADTFTVKAKWNMIGTIGYPVDSAAVRTQPAGILQSSFYGYDPDSGYLPAGTLLPGRAYWVRSASAGNLILSIFSPAAQPGAVPSQAATARSAELVITDAALRRRTLRYGPADSAAPPAAELPPPPPAGAFDVRFASGLSIERPAAGGVKESPILIAGMRLPATVRWRPGSEPVPGASLIINGETIPLTGEGERTIGAIAGPTLLRFDGDGSAGIPAGFSLDGNYPNPFNPSTKISFALPEPRFVSLTVFDLLGREAVELAGRVMEAGRHEVPWDATGFPSGVYFYRLAAGEYSATGKMALMK